jgi:CheY-like chemotaxis protein
MNDPSRPKILLIEDETKTARAVLDGLRTEGFVPSLATTGEEGFFLSNSEPFDAIVLDWMLPGRSGLEVLKTLRARGSKMPVLLLTARDALEDRVAGLDAGADANKFLEELWLVDAAARSLKVYRRKHPSDFPAVTLTRGESYSCPLFPGLDLSLAEIFVETAD